jgi:hypothetical protein
MSDLISDTAKSVLETTPGKSLIQEVQTLREQQVELTKAVRALCTLMSVLDRKVDAVLKGNADCAVL